MMTRSAIFLLASAFAAVLTLAAQPRGAQAAPVWKTSPERGFLDDAMAFDSGGQRFAYIHSDSATFTTIKLVDLATRQPSGTIDGLSPKQVPRSLAFSEDGSRLLYLASDAKTETYQARLFDSQSGKPIGKPLLGLTWASAIAYQGTPHLAAVVRRGNPARAHRIELSLYSLSEMRRVKRATIAILADGTLRKPPLRVLYWGPGHLWLVGMKRGGYDKKRDIRLPDAAARYDLITGQIAWTHAPKQLVSWNNAVNLRNDHPYMTQFAHVSNDMQKLLFVDEKNAIHALKTAVPWHHYEPKSLTQKESWRDGALYLSLTIDPVNRDAVAKKKADRERCDIYRVNSDRSLSLLGAILTDKRRFTWAVGNRHIAYLRKLKGFGRGGKTLEIYAQGEDQPYQR